MDDTKIKIFLVDDDKFILEAMAEYLRGNGYRTETAQTCKQACDRIAEFPLSATRMFPFASRESPVGPLIVADVAGPRSPVAPAVPAFPQTVVTSPGTFLAERDPAE